MPVLFPEEIGLPFYLDRAYSKHRHRLYNTLHQSLRSLHLPGFPAWLVWRMSTSDRRANASWAASCGVKLYM
ncbi:hypothetical protein PISMIDRAFT_676298 [Pisolithus microcarpus 441]|uniref:Uncharacterized protein n=1 Tax=Pisolithus microcarpus 441 TaxID=765257 RepID=A0A0C9ZVB7_9AGAM|nr:hypothetical protein PISMIDRAFT_676298 [Pisolithus microcarpus 441]